MKNKKVFLGLFAVLSLQTGYSVAAMSEDAKYILGCLNKSQANSLIPYVKRDAEKLVGMKFYEAKAYLNGRCAEACAPTGNQQSNPFLCNLIRNNPKIIGTFAARTHNANIDLNFCKCWSGLERYNYAGRCMDEVARDWSLFEQYNYDGKLDDVARNWFLVEQYNYDGKLDDAASK